MPVQLTSPSGVAGLRGTPCDVPGNVRLGRPAGAAPCYARFLDRQAGH
ncbi:MAG: hypothetical protein HW385_482, partial [candidate division NC10 bacterium]|nr:hypothetical protein [candidate division NC10 bacterium]